MMGGLAGFLFVYFLGGLTFMPLLAAALFLHAYVTLPTYEDKSNQENGTDSITRPDDDGDVMVHTEKSLREPAQPRNNHEADVAAGYFTICREYAPMGSATVPPAGQTVYQSMYRSIFDRKQSSSPLDNKGTGKPQKSGNVFYVVLRHGHLMLFDDDDQLEVRHVISLAHHSVSIYSGGDETPEGELFIRRNAICLSRKIDGEESTPDSRTSNPFFLFSENCSDKEDFYFALLRNQERKPSTKENPPLPLQYDIRDIITLVQRLHSSEEHLQTRWINAVIGRVFLALYKTPEVEDFIRAKITKKISRVKTPSFLSKIVLRHIDMGQAAPVITNPRLKDLTVDGELIVEADVRYTGNFRIEVAATARIELGTRIKAREVNLLLAVVLKRIDGHAMVRIKPPPSNRLWVAFQSMPKIDMAIEPIVSSRQITYTVILRQIENRIKEVIAESLVFPNWDDYPFYHTDNKLWRGGIWTDENNLTEQDPTLAAAVEGDIDQLAQPQAGKDDAITALPQLEKSMSMPLVDTPTSGTAFPRKSAKSATNIRNIGVGASSTSVETRPSDKPRAPKPSPFASVSPPIASTDVSPTGIHKEPALLDCSQAASAMAATSTYSQTNMPNQSPLRPPSRSSMDTTSRLSLTSSRDSTPFEEQAQSDQGPSPSIDALQCDNPNPWFYTHSQNRASIIPPNPPDNPSAPSGIDLRQDEPSLPIVKPSATETKRLSLAAVANAAATARKWGWNAMQRHGDQKNDTTSEFASRSSPPRIMGRGRPLPPPGTPLPPPDKKSKIAPIPVLKRKPIPPPVLLPQPRGPTDELDESPSQPGDLPLASSKQPRRNETDRDTADDGLLIVAAPAGDSEPTTPMSEHAPTYVSPWVDDADDAGEIGESEAARKDFEPTHLTKRRQTHRVLSSSPEEDGPQLPTWMAAQEREARAKSAFVDEDTGV